MRKRNDKHKASLDDVAVRRLSTDIPRTVAECARLLSTLRAFGIVATYAQLEQEEIMPEACMRSASRDIEIMAFHGDKWLFESWLEPQLQRLRLRQGKARFLLSDTIDERTRTKCRELRHSHSEVFEARLFSEPAFFRAIIIDDSRLLLGHYGYEVIEKDGSNAKGWKSPQLLIEDNKNWSLLIPFRGMFRNAWDKAEVVEAGAPADKGTVKRDFHPTNR
jgi:hypothetical protein